MDIFSSAVLNRVVQDLKSTTRAPFLLDRYFSEAANSTAEEIFFDVLTGKPRLAPFCSPLVEGRIVQGQGYAAKSFKPAYIKDKRVFEDGKPVRRLAGQPIGGPLDPMTNRRLRVAEDSQDQINMLYRRLEWMAAQAMRTGTITVSGEGYPTTLVDFGRDASLSIELLTTAKWDQGTATPLDDLETWAGLARSKGGGRISDVIMAENVWQKFRAFDEVKEIRRNDKNLSPSTTIDLGPQARDLGFTDQGVVGAFHVFTYSDIYVDDAGDEQSFLPDDYLIMTGQSIEGVRFFGAIKDEKAGFQATDFFSKSWTVEDPAARYLMLQSAPLVVPYRPNASVAVKVM